MKTPSRKLCRALRFYAWLLKLYPPAYQRAFGAQMQQTFRDQYADACTQGASPGLLFWLDVVIDEAKSIVREHLAALGESEEDMTPTIYRTATRTPFWAFTAYMLCYFLVFLDKLDAPWDMLRETNALVAGAYIVQWVAAAAALVVIAGFAVWLGVTLTTGIWLRQRKWQWGLPLVTWPLLVALSIVLHDQVLHGEFWDNTLFLFSLLIILGLPLLIGLVITHEDIEVGTRPLTFVVATLLTGTIVLMLASTVLMQVVTSLVWSTGNWSFQLVVGFALLMLPTGLAVRMIKQGIATRTHPLL